MQKITIALLALLLSSCSTNKVEIPADLMQPCFPRDKFTGKTSNDLVSYAGNLQGQYDICATQHNGLIEAVKKETK